MPTYLITGANRGLGLEFVRQLINSKVSNNIIAAVRSFDGDLDDLRELEKRGSRRSPLHIVECDTSSTISIQSIIGQIQPLIGDGHVDVLVNNAGINSAPARNALTIEPVDIQQHINVNVTGPAELTKAIVPIMVRGGLIVNMTSGLGSFGKGIFGYAGAAYSISKAALNMLAAHQAQNVADQGLRVICMDPGHVKTRMGGDDAVLTPNESVSGMLDVIQKVFREQEAGLGEAKCYQHDGQEAPW